MVTIINLPNEIIQLIFDNLSLDDQMNFKNTCKKFNMFPYNYHIFFENIEERKLYDYKFLYAIVSKILKDQKQIYYNIFIKYQLVFEYLLDSINSYNPEESYRSLGLHYDEDFEGNKITNVDYLRYDEYIYIELCSGDDYDGDNNIIKDLIDYIIKKIYNFTYDIIDIGIEYRWVSCYMFSEKGFHSDKYGFNSIKYEECHCDKCPKNFENHMTTYDLTTGGPLWSYYPLYCIDIGLTY